MIQIHNNVDAKRNQDGGGGGKDWKRNSEKEAKEAAKALLGVLGSPPTGNGNDSNARGNGGKSCPSTPLLKVRFFEHHKKKNSSNSETIEQQLQQNQTFVEVQGKQKGGMGGRSGKFHQEPDKIVTVIDGYESDDQLQRLDFPKHQKQLQRNNRRSERSDRNQHIAEKNAKLNKKASMQVKNVGGENHHVHRVSRGSGGELLREQEGLDIACLEGEIHQTLKNRPSMGVGMGIGLMMQQAGLLAGYTAPQTDVTVLKDQIRRAKAEGKTVTILNGFLYIDYQLKATLPPNFRPE